MSPSATRTVGQEPDPAKRLRQAWGSALRETRKFNGDTIEDLRAKLEAAGYPLTAQAISSWERGETAPRWHHQAAVAKVYGVPRHRLFSDEAA